MTRFLLLILFSNKIFHGLRGEGKQNKFQDEKYIGMIIIF